MSNPSALFPNHQSVCVYVCVGPHQLPVGLFRQKCCLYTTGNHGCLHYGTNISGFFWCRNHCTIMLSLCFDADTWKVINELSSGECCSPSFLVRDRLTANNETRSQAVNITFTSTVHKYNFTVLVLELRRSDRIPEKLWQESSVQPKSLPETAVPPISLITPSGPNMKSYFVFVYLFVICYICIFYICLFVLSFIMSECICILMWKVWCL